MDIGNIFIWVVVVIFNVATFWSMSKLTRAGHQFFSPRDGEIIFLTLLLGVMISWILIINMMWFVK